MSSLKGERRAISLHLLSSQDRTVKMCVACMLQPSQLCQTHVTLASWGPECLPVCPQWPQRSEACVLPSVLPAALAPERAHPAWGFPSPLLLFGGPPAWQLRWLFQDTQGGSPELGSPSQETHSETPRTAGFSIVLAELSPVSYFGTLFVWGCFSAQLDLHLGWGWKASSPPCCSPSPASWC